MKIDLNALRNVQFSMNDVFSTDQQRSKRRSLLQKSQLLGNLYKRRVNIFFHNIEGKVGKVEATIWSVGSEFVLLGSGVVLPIRAIEHVDF